MISAVLIWEGCGNYAGVILGTTQGIIIPEFKKFTKSFGTDRYTLIEQSGNYAHWQVALKIIALAQMHVVRKTGFSSD